MILDDLRRWIDGRLTPWAHQKGLEALPAYTLEEPPSGIEADIACNLALLLAKPLRQSPRTVAQDLLQALSEGEGPVQELAMAGAGFINLRWKMETLYQELRSL